MQRVAVAVTYYNRSKLFFKTLETIKRSTHDNYRVIVVDDGSIDDPLAIDDSLVDVITVLPDEKLWRVAVAFNIGVAHALQEYNPDIIVVQNAECYHVDDVLMYANGHVRDGQCVSFACWNDEGRDPDVMKAIADDTDHTYGSGWYNHPVNPRLFNFCNAYSRNDMLLLNGMDERFKDGVGCDDNDLVRRMHILGLNVLITDETKPFVVHQHHDREHLVSNELWERNRALYYRVRMDEATNYRAQHTITEDFV